MQSMGCGVILVIEPALAQESDAMFRVRKEMMRLLVSISNSTVLLQCPIAQLRFNAA